MEDSAKDPLLKNVAPTECDLNLGVEFVKPKRKRSSILKPPRSSHLHGEEHNDSKEKKKRRRSSKRVSFAETFQVKEFLKDTPEYEPTEMETATWTRTPSLNVSSSQDFIKYHERDNRGCSGDKLERPQSEKDDAVEPVENPFNPVTPSVSSAVNNESNDLTSGLSVENDIPKGSLKRGLCDEGFELAQKVAIIQECPSEEEEIPAQLQQNSDSVVNPATTVKDAPITGKSQSDSDTIAVVKDDSSCPPDVNCDVGVDSGNAATLGKRVSEKTNENIHGVDNSNCKSGFSLPLMFHPSNFYSKKRKVESCVSNKENLPSMIRKTSEQSTVLRNNEKLTNLESKGAPQSIKNVAAHKSKTSKKSLHSPSQTKSQSRRSSSGKSLQVKSAAVNRPSNNNVTHDASEGSYVPNVVQQVYSSMPEIINSVDRAGLPAHETYLSNTSSSKNYDSVKNLPLCLSKVESDVCSDQIEKTLNSFVPCHNNSSVSMQGQNLSSHDNIQDISNNVLRVEANKQGFDSESSFAYHSFLRSRNLKNVLDPICEVSEIASIPSAGAPVAHTVSVSPMKLTSYCCNKNEKTTDIQKNEVRCLSFEQGSKNNMCANICSKESRNTDTVMQVPSSESYLPHPVFSERLDLVKNPFEDLEEQLAEETLMLDYAQHKNNNNSVVMEVKKSCNSSGIEMKHSEAQEIQNLSCSQSQKIFSDPHSPNVNFLKSLNSVTDPFRDLGEQLGRETVSFTAATTHFLENVCRADTRNNSTLLSENRIIGNRVNSTFLDSSGNSHLLELQNSSSNLHLVYVRQLESQNLIKNPFQDLEDQLVKGTSCSPDMQAFSFKNTDTGIGERTEKTENQEVQKLSSDLHTVENHSSILCPSHDAGSTGPQNTESRGSNLPCNSQLLELQNISSSNQSYSDFLKSRGLMKNSFQDVEEEVAKEIAGSSAVQEDYHKKFDSVCRAKVPSETGASHDEEQDVENSGNRAIQKSSSESQMPYLTCSNADVLTTVANCSVTSTVTSKSPKSSPISYAIDRHSTLHVFADGRTTIFPSAEMELTCVKETDLFNNVPTMAKENGQILGTSEKTHMFTSAHMDITRICGLSRDTELNSPTADLSHITNDFVLESCHSHISGKQNSDDPEIDLNNQENVQAEYFVRSDSDIPSLKIGAANVEDKIALEESYITYVGSSKMSSNKEVYDLHVVNHVPVCENNILNEDSPNKTTSDVTSFSSAAKTCEESKSRVTGAEKTQIFALVDMEMTCLNESYNLNDNLTTTFNNDQNVSKKEFISCDSREKRNENTICGYEDMEFTCINGNDNSRCTSSTFSNKCNPVVINENERREAKNSVLDSSEEVKNTLQCYSSEKEIQREGNMACSDIKKYKEDYGNSLNKLCMESVHAKEQTFDKTRIFNSQDMDLTNVHISSIVSAGIVDWTSCGTAATCDVLKVPEGTVFPAAKEDKKTCIFGPADMEMTCVSGYYKLGEYTSNDFGYNVSENNAGNNFIKNDCLIKKGSEAEMFSMKDKSKGMGADAKHSGQEVPSILKGSPENIRDFSATDSHSAAKQNSDKTRHFSVADMDMTCVSHIDSSEIVAYDCAIENSALNDNTELKTGEEQNVFVANVPCVMQADLETAAETSCFVKSNLDENAGDPSSDNMYMRTKCTERLEDPSEKSNAKSKNGLLCDDKLEIPIAKANEVETSGTCGVDDDNSSRGVGTENFAGEKDILNADITTVANVGDCYDIAKVYSANKSHVAEVEKTQIFALTDMEMTFVNENNNDPTDILDCATGYSPVEKECTYHNPSEKGNERTKIFAYEDMELTCISGNSRSRHSICPPSNKCHSDALNVKTQCFNMSDGDMSSSCEGSSNVKGRITSEDFCESDVGSQKMPCNKTEVCDPHVVNHISVCENDILNADVTSKTVADVMNSHNAVKAYESNKSCITRTENTQIFGLADMEITCVDERYNLNSDHPDDFICDTGYGVKEKECIVCDPSEKQYEKTAVFDYEDMELTCINGNGCSECATSVLSSECHPDAITEHERKETRDFLHESCLRIQNVAKNALQGCQGVSEEENEGEENMACRNIIGCNFDDDDRSLNVANNKFCTKNVPSKEQTSDKTRVFNSQDMELTNMHMSSIVSTGIVNRTSCDAADTCDVLNVSKETGFPPVKENEKTCIFGSADMEMTCVRGNYKLGEDANKDLDSGEKNIENDWIKNYGVKQNKIEEVEVLILDDKPQCTDAKYFDSDAKYSSQKNSGVLKVPAESIGDYTAVNSHSSAIQEREKTQHFSMVGMDITCVSCENSSEFMTNDFASQDVALNAHTDNRTDGVEDVYVISRPCIMESSKGINTEKAACDSSDDNSSYVKTKRDEHVEDLNEKANSGSKDLLLSGDKLQIQKSEGEKIEGHVISAMLKDDGENDNSSLKERYEARTEYFTSFKMDVTCVSEDSSYEENNLMFHDEVVPYDNQVLHEVHSSNAKDVNEPVANNNVLSSNGNYIFGSEKTIFEVGDMEMTCIDEQANLSNTDFGVVPRNSTDQENTLKINDLAMHSCSSGGQVTTTPTIVRLLFVQSENSGEDERDESEKKDLAAVNFDNRDSSSPRPGAYQKMDSDPQNIETRSCIDTNQSESTGSLAPNKIQKGTKVKRPNTVKSSQLSKHLKFDVLYRVKHAKGKLQKIYNEKKISKQKAQSISVSVQKSDSVIEKSGKKCKTNSICAEIVPNDLTHGQINDQIASGIGEMFTDESESQKNEQSGQNNIHEPQVDNSSRSVSSEIKDVVCVGMDDMAYKASNLPKQVSSKSDFYDAVGEAGHSVVSTQESCNFPEEKESPVSVKTNVMEVEAAEVDKYNSSLPALSSSSLDGSTSPQKSIKMSSTVQDFTVNHARSPTPECDLNTSAGKRSEGETQPFQVNCHSFEKPVDDDFVKSKNESVSVDVNVSLSSNAKPAVPCTILSNLVSSSTHEDIVGKTSNISSSPDSQAVNEPYVNVDENNKTADFSINALSLCQHKNMNTKTESLLNDRSDSRNFQEEKTAHFRKDASLGFTSSSAPDAVVSSAALTRLASPHPSQEDLPSAAAEEASPSVAPAEVSPALALSEIVPSAAILPCSAPSKSTPAELLPAVTPTAVIPSIASEEVLSSATSAEACPSVTAQEALPHATPEEVLPFTIAEEVLSSAPPTEVLQSAIVAEVLPSAEVLPNGRAKEVLSSAIPEEIVSSSVPAMVLSSAMAEEVVSSSVPVEVLPSAVAEEVVSSSVLAEVLPSAIAEEVVSSSVSADVLPSAMAEEVVSSVLAEVLPSAMAEEVVPSMGCAHQEVIPAAVATPEEVLSSSMGLTHQEVILPAVAPPVEVLSSSMGLTHQEVFPSAIASPEKVLPSDTIMHGVSNGTNQRRNSCSDFNMVVPSSLPHPVPLSCDITEPVAVESKYENSGIIGGFLITHGINETRFLPEYADIGEELLSDIELPSITDVPEQSVCSHPGLDAIGKPDILANQISTTQLQPSKNSKEKIQHNTPLSSLIQDMQSSLYPPKTVCDMQLSRKLSDSEGDDDIYIRKSLSERLQFHSTYCSPVSHHDSALSKVHPSGTVNKGKSFVNTVQKTSSKCACKTSVDDLEITAPFQNLSGNKTRNYLTRRRKNLFTNSSESEDLDLSGHDTDAKKSTEERTTESNCDYRRTRSRTQIKQSKRAAAELQIEKECQVNLTDIRHLVPGGVNESQGHKKHTRGAEEKRKECQPKIFDIFQPVLRTAKDEKCLWEVKCLQEDKVIFTFLWNTLFLSMMLHEDIDSPYIKKLSSFSWESKFKGPTTGVGKLSHNLFFKTVGDTNLEGKYPDTSHLLQLLEHLSLAAKQAMMLIMDVEHVSVSHKFCLENDFELCVEVFSLATKSISRLRFPIDIATYPNAKIIPQVEHIRGQVHSEMILKAMSAVEPASQYIWRMVQSVDSYFDSLAR